MSLTSGMFPWAGSMRKEVLKTCLQKYTQRDRGKTGSDKDSLALKTVPPLVLTDNCKLIMLKLSWQG